MNKPYITLPDISFDDIDILKYTLVSNDNFKKIWYNFAHSLGFFGTKGLNQRIIGKGIDVYNYGDNGDFLIRPKNTKLPKNPSDPPYKYLIIRFFNFKLKFLSDSLVMKPPILRNFDPQATSSTNYMNKTDGTINVSKKISFTTSDTTSVSYSNEITNEIGVGANASFKFPGISKSTSINYNFSHQYTLGNQEDITNTTQFSDQVSFDLEPKTKVPLKLISAKSLAQSSFKALALISFNVEFDGYLYIKKNAFKNELKPSVFYKSLAPIKHTFGNDTMSAIEDINHQIARKNIPLSSVWNWDIFNANSMKYLTNNFTSFMNGFVVEFNGKFSKINSTNSVFEIGPSTPI